MPTSKNRSRSTWPKRPASHAAAGKGVRVGSAPDTFLGGGIQTCRKLIDDGAIGRPVAATAFMVGQGHEHWHPSPVFYYQQGGGPMFDMGPYYITALVNRIGPVKRVTGSTGMAFPERTIKKALSMTREDILFELKDSKLKGRGGAGFPTSTKWMLTAATKSNDKFLVCNADEGEPGTFKDRVLLMEYPELVFVGMVVGGYTIGAQKGIVYLRGEYEYLLKPLEDYLEVMRKDNLLGKNILGKKDFSFDIEVFLGSGAYVCGEETALIESLEGHRGEPRNRPPYPINTGYLGRPTSVNNVETLAAVSHIVIKGGSWFAKSSSDMNCGAVDLKLSSHASRRIESHSGELSNF